MTYVLPILLLFCFTCSALSYNIEEENLKKADQRLTEKRKIKIKVSSKTFTGTLLDNKSANAFKEMLPMTAEMTDLNSNEKYVRLPENLPTNASNPGSIRPGDLMLFGSNTIVLFYEGLNTSYSYTRLGKIDDPTGLRNALGTGNVTVTYEVE